MIENFNEKYNEVLKLARKRLSKEPENFLLRCLVENLKNNREDLQNILDDKYPLYHDLSRGSHHIYKNKFYGPVDDINYFFTFFAEEIFRGYLKKPSKFPHGRPMSQFLYFLVKDQSPEKQKEIMKAINIFRPVDTCRNLEQLKIAKGQKLIEVAGDHYSKLISLFGGKGVYSCRGTRQSMGIYDTQGNFKSIENTSNAEEVVNQYIEVFGKNYDIFMAINHGEIKDVNLSKVATALLKPKKIENQLIYLLDLSW